MARYKDANWSLSDTTLTWDEAAVAVLMDIRDELKRLNRLLHCSNFTDIPWTLKTIARKTTTVAANTTRRRRKAK